MRRGLAVGVAVGAAVAAAAGGWLAGRNITSPEQAALEAEPPPASLITVEVELAELTADVITRADVGYDEPTALSLSGALGDRESALVVTAAPERGASLAEGEAAIEVAGRPVFLLAGAVPVFRDLRPQDRGPDVEQLEQALARLGHFDGEPDQLWDHATGAAVEAWYAAAGYRASGVSDAEQDLLRTARDRVARARDELAAADKALAEALKGPTDLDVQRARTEVASAASALQDARRRAGQTDAQAQATLTDARLAVSAAERAWEAAERDTTDAELARQAAVRAVEDARRLSDKAQASVGDAQWAVGTAWAAREQAANRFAQAEFRWQSAQAGVHPDTGETPTPAEHEALRLASAEAARALGEAERAVADAEESVSDAAWAVADADLAVAEAERAVTGAAARVADAQLAAERARADLEQRRADVPDAADRSQAIDSAELAERQAEDRLAAAEHSLAELLAPADTDELSSRVDDARSEVDEAVARLDELEESTGVWLPAGELIVLNRLPVRVDRITAEQGSRVSGSFMTVTGSELAVRGSVSERDVARIGEGAEARIEDRGLAEPVEGVIRLVDPRAGTRGVAPDRHYIEMVADGIPEDLVGKNVKVVIPVGGTDGAVLVVPVAALSATADGTTRVEVEQPDGSTRFVEVAAGLSTGGRVEVTPVAGELRAGDRVVVGQASGG